MRIAVALILAFFSQLAYTQADANYRLQTITDNLNSPWSIAFLPNGDYLVSMLGGELRRVSKSGEIGPALQNTPATYVAGQGGYFDVVLDPDFNSNQTIYLAFAHGTPDANATRIIKATLSAEGLENVTPIFTVNPLKDTPVHYGGRLLFLADKTLLLTTGDGFEYRESAQDKYSQMGKIIRINRDGSIPADNPFVGNDSADPAIYTYGHRSPQGLDLDPKTNTVFMHEHGPQGGDEVNIVKPGANYGWPAVAYGANYSGALVTPLTEAEGVEQPLRYWVPSIAPSGLAYCACENYPQWQNSLFVGALVDQEVSRLSLQGGKVNNEERLFGELKARIRDVRLGPNGYLHILTDGENASLIKVLPN